MITPLLLSGLSLLAQPSEIPCNRLVKVIVTGSIAERKAMAASVTAPPEAVAKACPELLRRGFGDPLRAQLPAPSIETWKVENQWLAAYLLKTAPRDAAYWIRKIDVNAIPPETLLGLIEHWGSETTAATPAIFALLDRVPSPAFRNEVLHRLEPTLIRLEMTDVTTATQMQGHLERLGFGHLTTDEFRSSLWTLRFNNAPEEITAAEMQLALGDLDKAFRHYGAAAKKDERYLIHAALSAEELLRRGTLSVTELQPLNLDFRKCGEIYTLNWNLAALYHVGRRLKDPEARAVMHERLNSKCADEFWEQSGASSEASQRFAKSITARRSRLAALAVEADKADMLWNQGRRIQANQARERIWQEVHQIDRFPFLGGPTRARRLQSRVGQYLAFPPVPEVRVNENDHLKRNERGEIVKDERPDPLEDDGAYFPRSDSE